MKKTPLRKTTEKRLKKLEEKKKILEKDREFYLNIWNKRKHVCYETGKYLGKEPLSVFFHHLLPKEKYTEFRWEEKNLVLLSWEAHNHVETNIDKCPKTKLLYEEVKNLLLNK